MTLLAGKAVAQGQLKGETQKDGVTIWYNHYKNLLRSPPDISDEDKEIAPILEGLKSKVGTFSDEEYEKTKKFLAERKTSAEDNLPPEVLERCDLDDIVLDFCNDALLEGKKPSHWSILNIEPIPKSGDLSIGGNYSGIRLSSIVAKIYNWMILNRIRQAPENQPEWLQQVQSRQNNCGAHTGT